MSPWSRERVEARLSPAAVTLRRLARGRELNRYRYEVEAVGNAHDWRPPLALMQAKIEALGWRKADLEIVLSSHYTRFAVMPWVANITERDAAAYAAHQFRSVYGSSADAWTVCLGPVKPPHPRVAAAAEQFLNGLEAKLRYLESDLAKLRSSQRSSPER